MDAYYYARVGQFAFQKYHTPFVQGPETHQPSGFLKVFDSNPYSVVSS